VRDVGDPLVSAVRVPDQLTQASEEHDHDSYRDQGDEVPGQYVPPGGLPAYMKYRGMVATPKMPVVTPDIPVMRRTVWVFMCLLPSACASERLMLWWPQEMRLYAVQ
jgi:hypothetical protein